MSEQSSKGQYLIIFRGTDWCKGLSPEQMQAVAGEWKQWFTRLTEQGKALAGNPLEPEGKVVSGKNGRVVVDGPFAESKESIAGYFFLQVPTFEEAVDIAKECPGLEYGAKVEVRPIAEMCPMSRVAEAELAAQR